MTTPQEQTTGVPGAAGPTPVPDVPAQGRGGGATAVGAHDTAYDAAGTATTGTATTGTATTGTAGTARGSGEDRSLGEIVSDVTSDLSRLFQQEVELAKTELKQELTKAGKGAGLLGGAGVAGLYFLGFASLALVWLLDNWLPVEASAGIVALLWGAVAAVLGLTGKKDLQEANPQLPQTQRSIEEDKEWLRAQKS